MSIRSRIVGCLLATGCAAAAFAQPAFIPVDFASNFNGRVQDIGYCGTTYPSGAQIYGGVPFAIPATGPNAWFSASGPATLDIALDVPGAAGVHSIMNTFWGEQSPGSFAQVEFFGSAGAYFKKDLDGNVDVRDFLNGFWTNTINGTSTINVFTSPGSCTAGQTRLDKQRYELPAAFHTQRLVRILFTDAGGTGFQRIFVHGVTVETTCPRFDGAIPDRAPCPTGSTTMSAAPAGVGPFTFVWELQDAAAPGGWRTLTDGELVVGGQSWGTISGVSSANLQAAPFASSPLVAAQL